MKIVKYYMSMYYEHTLLVLADGMNRHPIFRKYTFFHQLPFLESRFLDPTQHNNVDRHCSKRLQASGRGQYKNI